MLFHYNTLTVKLFPVTKSLKVYLKEEFFSKEMLFELEGLFAWLSNHIEVNSVLFSSDHNHFCKGFSNNEAEKIESVKLQKYYERIQKLTHMMAHLPQTFIVDLKNGANAEGAEFVLGADIIIASQNCSLHFNHISQGKTPQCGGIGLLKAKVGFAKAKNWVLLEKQIDAEELLSTGLVDQLYSPKTKKPEQPILEKINNQSPIARIQTKRSLLESILPEVENSTVFESIFAKATLTSEDWKQYLESSKNNENPIFQKARNITPPA